MCGISGAIGAFSMTEACDITSSMTSVLEHRGPDDCGLASWEFGGNAAAFGHTRLSILDLSAAGRQPMTERSGRYWTTFNGEIYNFQELRRLLDSDNNLFRTATDTEAILHAYHRWGVQAFGRFRGMFAFALLDKQDGVVHLVRDPLGIKPLYYYFDGNKLLFASEVQALLSSGVVPRRIDSESVSHYLSFGWVGGSDSMISGVRLLPPGHMVTVDLRAKQIALRVTKYEPEISVEGDLPESDREESTAHMLHLLEQSVKCHLLSDVPVGLFLSGGIDSTAILHLMREVGCRAPKTFTVVFPEKEFSERAFARQVAQRYETDHHELSLSESELFNQLPEALAAMDQPTMDGVNTFVVAKAVRSAGVKVALSGLGSDELFAGYPSFRRARLARLAAKVPRPFRAAVAVGGRCLTHSPSAEKVWDLISSDCTPLSAYQISRRLFTMNESIGLRTGMSRSSTWPDVRFSGDEVNDMSRLEMSGYMTGLLLRDTDFMSMASSLEVRVPFIDKMVIRHALNLPGRWKLSPFKPKSLLLDSMRGAVPEYVWDRKKMGFVFPFDRWMRSGLRPQVEETLNNGSLADAAGLDLSAVRRVWQGFLDGDCKWSKPWSLFVLLRWCERQRASI